MNHLKKCAALCLAAAMCALCLAGCGKKPQVEGLLQAQEDYAKFPQAVLSIADYGDVTVALFEDEAPKAVENFITHAENGYYDGLTFHRVVSDFVIQGGDPKGDGTGGESIWGGKFDDEISDNLYHFRGAVCYANAGPNSNGSQFYIVTPTAIHASFDDAKAYHEYYGYGVTEWSKAVQDQYQAVGGTPELDGMYTIFGQVIEGMEIVDQIQSVSVDANDRPREDVVISSVTIQKPE